MEQFLDLLDLEGECLIRIDASLLQKVVMNLLERLELKIVLDYLASHHQGPDRHIELDSASHCLFVFPEDLVHDYFDLIESFFIGELVEFIFDLVLDHDSDSEGILLLVAASD